MLSPLAKAQWITAGGVGLVIAIGALLAGWWPLALIAVGVAGLYMWHLRDPRRAVPQMRGLIVACADGRVVSVETLEAFEPLGGPAVRLRVEPRWSDVHLVRAPLQGAVVSVERKAAESGPPSTRAEASALLVHPTDRRPIAVVRLIAGGLPGVLVCATTRGDVLQRGQRFGHVPPGATVELCLAEPERLDLRVGEGQKLRAGDSVIAALRDDV